MNARISSFELPLDWDKRSELDKKQRRTTKAKSNNQQTGNLLGEQVIEGRKKMNLSQRELAKLMEKSQSWIRDVEKGRLKAKLDDQMLLKQLLDIS
jgi:ribosome-binding protein aMBF1 (putative translation factor)